MTSQTTSQPPRDNLFGICAALGEDFGFDPLWLRIALGAGVLWNPLAMLGLYVTLGAAVLVTRLAFPDRKAAAPVAVQAADTDVPDTDVPELAHAA